MTITEQQEADIQFMKNVASAFERMTHDIEDLTSRIDLYERVLANMIVASGSSTIRVPKISNTQEIADGLKDGSLCIAVGIGGEPASTIVELLKQVSRDEWVGYATNT